MLKFKSKQAAVCDDAAPRSARSFLLRCAAAAGVCFLASFGNMVGFPSFMNVACAVIAGRFSPAAFIGALLSYSVQGRLAESAIQIAAIAVCSAVNFFFPAYSKNGDPIRLSLFTAAVTLLLSGVSSAVSPDGFLVSMRIISSLMCACVVYAAAFVIERARSGEPVRLCGLTAVYCAMLYIAAIATLSSCQLGIFNIGRVCACAAIPAAAKKRRAAGGAVMGALTAVSVTLCSSALSVNTMLLAAAGLICSAFCDLGCVAAALSFMISASAALAAAGLNSDTFHMLADIIAGSVIFAAMPRSLPYTLMSRFVILNSPSDTAGQTASSRLAFASMTINDIRDKLAAVSHTVENRSESITLEDRVAEAACRRCRLCDECRRNGCMNNMLSYCRGELPEAVGCVRAAELSKIITRCREEQLADRAEAVRLKEMRGFLQEQLGSMTDILGDLSCRLSRRREVDARLSAAAKSYFERQGFKGVRACVYTDENCCRHAEIYLTGKFEKDALQITAGLCRALDCDLDLPGVTSADRITKLEFDETPPFKAEFGCYTALGSGSCCSGDTLETVDCSAGERYVLLSDGMGSGKRARLDSAMSVNLAAHMLRSGLSMSTAQRMINSVMQVKDWEESFATLDFLRLDLFSGRAEFLKSGAAPAYLCRDGSMVKIDCDSFPAGILPSCDPNVSSCKLFDGDVLLLASDGAPEKTLMRFSELAEDTRTEADDLAYSIGSLCTAASCGVKSDDITVAVVKISYKKERVCM